MKINRKREYVIFNCCDAAYLKYIGPHYLSIMKHFGRDIEESSWHLSLLLFYAGVPNEDCEKLEMLVASVSRELKSSISLTIVPIDCVVPADNTRWPRVVYLRFLVASVCPTYTERALYLDIDIHCNGDISSIFETKFSDSEIVAAVVDRCEDKETFNSGVILYHLPKFRSGKYEDKLFETQERMVSNLQYPDQDVLNAVFRYKWHALSFIWNFRHHYSTVPGARLHCKYEFCLSKCVRSICDPETEVKLVHTALSSSSKLWNNVNCFQNDPLTKGYGDLVHQCETALEIEIGSTATISRLFQYLFMSLVTWDIHLETVKDVLSQEFLNGTKAVSYKKLMTNPVLSDRELVLYLLRKYEYLCTYSGNKPDKHASWKIAFVEGIGAIDKYDDRLQILDKVKFVRL